MRSRGCNKSLARHKPTVLLSHLEGRLVDVSRDHSGTSGYPQEYLAYKAVEDDNGHPVYPAVVVRKLLDLVERLSKEVRIARKSTDVNNSIIEPPPDTVGSLKLALSGYGCDLRMSREMLVGKDKKFLAMPHIDMQKFKDMLKDFNDSDPVRMLGKDGRKCGPPRPMIVKKGDNPFHVRIP